MKNLQISSLVFIIAGVISLSFTFSINAPFTESVNPGPIPNAFFKPDLRISQISTPGGLCVGNENKVRVTVTNSQMTGVKDPIIVHLFVSPQNGQPTSYSKTLEKGIGPNANYGVPVWFDNVSIPTAGNVTLRAVVNPDQEIVETVYNNNSKIQRSRARDCGQGGSSGNTATGKTLTVTVYQQGSWSAGNYTAISNAQVQVKKNNQVIKSGTTGSNGKVSLENVPKGYCTIIVQKNGCGSKSQNYNMPAYDTNVNRDLNCN